MRLCSVDITNFRVIRKAVLTFPDRVIGIVGPNGAGKSSIIEAVAWALYGNQASRTGKSQIKSAFAGGDENCEVDLTFAVRDETYRVVRRLVGRTERAEVELYRGESSESVGVNETKRYVGELLGLDWRGFLTSFLARQQELNALSDLQPSKRRDHLAGMLGIERLDKAIGAAKEDTRLSAGKAAFLERQLVEMEQVKKRVEELKQTIVRLAGRAASARSAFEKAEAELGAQALSFRMAQDARSEWLRLTTQLEAERKTLAGLKTQLGSLQEERTTLAAQQKELSSLQRDLEGMESVRQEIERLKEARNRQKAREELLARIGESTRERNGLEQTAAELRENLLRYDGILQSIPEDAGARAKAAEERLGKAREEYSRLRAEKDSLSKEIGRLEQQIESIKEFGPDSVCDRCLRPLGDDLERVRGHLNGELEQMRLTAAGVDSELEKKKADGERLKEDHQRGEAAVRLGYETTVRRQSAAADLANAEKGLVVLAEKLGKMQSQLGEFVGVAVDDDRLAQLTVRFGELEQAKSRHDRIKGTLERLPAVERAIDRTNQEIESVGAAKGKLESQLAAMAWSDERYRLAEKAYLEAQKIREAAQAEHVGFSKEQEVSGKELEGRQEQMRSLEKAAAELEECRANQYYGEKLTALFAEYRKHLIVRIRPTLAELSSRLISEMTDDRYSLIDLDEEYNLRVMDGGAYYDVERFSGGEKDLANLCLRLAISLALSEAAGLSRSFIILDEVFGSQDTGRRELIVKALSNLHGRFPQILLVTHIEEIKDQVEELIYVSPTGSGWSEVMVG